jgi:Flp pilus assembly protein TadG
MLFTMMLPALLLPVIGAAIDFTAMYIVKEKLQAAVDGAAIAAAQSLSAGTSFAPQQAAAQLCGQEFIAANIPTGSGPGGGGYWGAYTLQDSVVATQVPASKVTTVTISATVYLPMLFMRMLGENAATVGAYGQASRRSVVLVLVIDRSGSMGAELGAVQAGAAKFVNAFQGGTDMLGLVLISGSAFVAYPPHDWGKNPGAGAFNAAGPTGPDVDFNSSTVSPNMLDTLGNMTSGSNTGTAEGLMLAYKELQTANQPGAMNIIVLWTDGAPNGITADFNAGVLGTATNSLRFSGAAPTATNLSGCTNTNDGTTGQYPNVAANSILGWMAQWGGYAYNSNATQGVRERAQSSTAGMSVPLWTTLSAPGASGSDEVTLSHTSGPGNGCTWTDGSAINTVVNIPAMDYYGDATQGVNAPVPGTLGNQFTTSDYKQSNIWNTTTANCQKGAGGTGGVPLQLSGTFAGNASTSNTPSSNACQIGLASWNATDMAGRQIHADTVLSPIIYTMGYAGSVSGSGGVDVVLLSRLANVTGTALNPQTGLVYNTVYNNSITPGLYLQIQQVGDVSTAFDQLLSEILRLSQ